MDEKAKLIQQLDEARAKMRAVLEGIDTRVEIYPTWTIKEVLAHIAGWDDVSASSLRLHAGGPGEAPDRCGQRPQRHRSRTHEFGQDC